MRDPGRIHRNATSTMSAIMIVIGVAIIGRTVAAGGGALATGILIGVLFIAAGGLRLYVQTRQR
jgi:hypothetical protein